MTDERLPAPSHPLTEDWPGGRPEVGSEAVPPVEPGSAPGAAVEADAAGQPAASAAAPAEAPSPTGIEGDAAQYLEALLVETGPVEAPQPEAGGAPGAVRVELVGPHLRVAGTLFLGRFRRLSDLLNNHDGMLEIHDATVLYRDGTPTRVVAPSLWIGLTEVTFVGQVEDSARPTASPEFMIRKEPHTLIVVTPGHTLTGDSYIATGAEIAQFIESADPPFIPMTDVRTRSLADRRVISRYFFALLNRRHIIAATRLLPGMTPTGRTL